MNKIAKVEKSNELALLQYSDDQLDLIKRTVCQGSTNDELQLFMYQVQKTGLDPLAKQIYAIKRWNSELKREVMGIQTSIDGFRLIAERSGKYAGQLGPFWCGEDGVWLDVWTSDGPPAASKVAVLRHDFNEPCWGVARFAGYAQNKKGGGLSFMWASKGDIMIAKCAESLALRKAFPQELSGLYTSDEMDQATNKPEQTTKKEPKKTKTAWCGPLNVKDLGDKMEDFNADIKTVEDSASYEKLTVDAQGLLDQAIVDWPDGYTKTQTNMTEARERIEEIEGDQYGE